VKLDLGAIVQRAREAQEKLQALQRELARRTVEGSAGAGMVRATATGALRILRVEVDPELLASGDRAMLQDLVAAAVNAALETAQRMVQEEMQKEASRLQVQLGAPTPAGGGQPA
jgi:nucleoid-associated protein EbfC